MRTPKLFGLVAVAVLAVVALFPAAPAAAQHDRISAPSQSIEPASPPPEPPAPPPPPPSAPEPPPPPPEPSTPPAPEPSTPSIPEEHMRTAEPAPAPTDPGTVGRRITIEPPAPDAQPTDPGTVARRLPGPHPVPPPVPTGGDEPPFCPPYFPDGTLLGDMEAFAESPLPAEMSAVARELDAELALVQVFVSDPAGKPVTGLRKDDFLLFVDGEAAPIASFYAQTAAAAPGTDRALLERLVGLQTFYSLGFVPAQPSAGREHRIAVVVKDRPGLTVRARERRPEEGF